MALPYTDSGVLPQSSRMAPYLQSSWPRKSESLTPDPWLYCWSGLCMSEWPVSRSGSEAIPDLFPKCLYPGLRVRWPRLCYLGIFFNHLLSHSSWMI